jgi:hypothetical protein
LWIGEIRRIIIAIIVAYRTKKGEGINILEEGGMTNPT